MTVRLFFIQMATFGIALYPVKTWAQSNDPTPLVEEIESGQDPRPVQTRTFGKTSASDTAEDSVNIKSAATDAEEKNIDEEPPEESSQREKDFGPKDKARPISLRQVLEQGLRENIDQKVREYAKSLLRIDWRDAWEKFWLPSTNVFLQQNPHKVHHLYNAPSTSSMQTDHTRTGTGSFGLALGDYTVFNWGKDYLTYLNAEVSYDRGTEYLDEQRRDLKHSLISQYFTLAKANNKTKIYKEQLKHATFIYRMARERAQLKRIDRQEYLEARSEYLMAQDEYHKARLEAVGEDEKMANLLGDDLSTTYYLAEELRFKKVSILMQDSLSYAISKNSDLLNQKTRMQIGQRNYDLALKDTLPLPKFSINFGTYSYDWNKSGVESEFKTSNTTGNVELVASLNATWPIFGEGGFFKTRATYREFLEKRIEEDKFYDTKRRIELKVRSLYKSLTYLENKVEITGLRLENAQKNFDATLDNYVAGRARFDELRDALYDLKTTATENDQTKLDHLLAKLDLAKEMGVEDFPGENFESLANSKDGGK